MTDYKLLFLDIDGTILTPENEVEASTKHAISHVQEQGIEVFLATGRPLHEIAELADQLNVQSFIGYNGAYAKYHGKDLFQEPMNNFTISHFLKIAADYRHEAVLYTNSKNVFTNIDSPIMKKFMDTFHLFNNVEYSPSAPLEVLGMTLINLIEGESVLYEKEVGIHLSQVNVDGMRHCYDVIRDKVNKGCGVQMVLKHLGIAKERSIAFGDGMNDKEMLLNVGESFAMGNAHPDLFQFAKHQTTASGNSGIYNGLKSLGLVK